jgi:hypothetical protein
MKEVVVDGSAVFRYPSPMYVRGELVVLLKAEALVNVSSKTKEPGGVGVGEA